LRQIEHHQLTTRIRKALSMVLSWNNPKVLHPSCAPKRKENEWKCQNWPPNKWDDKTVEVVCLPVIGKQFEGQCYRVNQK